VLSTVFFYRQRNYEYPLRSRAILGFQQGAVVSLPCSIAQLKSLGAIDSLSEDQRQLIDWLLRSGDYDLEKVADEEVDIQWALLNS
jgi:hypothetical protein